MKRRVIFLIVCLAILISLPRQALAENWIKTDELKDNVWVDNSHYENKPKWMDTSYWSTKRILIPGGYWQTNQTLVSAGYYQTQNKLVSAGYWNNIQVLVKTGYWDTQKVLVKEGYWTYKEILIKAGYWDTKKVLVKAGYNETYWTGQWGSSYGEYWDGDWKRVNSIYEIPANWINWNKPITYHFGKYTHEFIRNIDSNTALFKTDWMQKRTWHKKWGWGTLGYDIARSDYYDYQRGYSYKNKIFKTRWVPPVYKNTSVWVPATYEKVKDKYIPAVYKTTQVWVAPVYQTEKVWIPPVYKTTQVWVPSVYKITKTYIDTSTYKDVPVYVNSGYWGTEQVWVDSGFFFDPQGTISLTKRPTYVFTQKAKLQDGSPAYMDLSVDWSNMNNIVLDVKAYHDVVRYKNRGTIRINGVLSSASLNSKKGTAQFRFTYPFAGQLSSKLYVEIILSNKAVVRVNAAIPINSFLGTYNQSAPDPVWMKSMANSGSISF